MADKARGGVYNNPNEMSFNPREIYPDGVFENYVNPSFTKTIVPAGSIIRPGTPGYRKTVNRRRVNRPGARREIDPLNMMGHIGASFPGGDGPMGPVPPEYAHDASLDATNNPANKYALAADPTLTHAAVQPYSVSSTDLAGIWGQLTEGYGPVAVIFGAGVVLLVLGSALGVGPFSRTGRAIGGGTGRVGRSIERGGVATGRTAMDGVNKTLGDAIDAVGDLAPGA